MDPQTVPESNPGFPDRGILVGAVFKYELDLESDEGDSIVTRHYKIWFVSNGAYTGSDDLRLSVPYHNYFSSLSAMGTLKGVWYYYGRNGTTITATARSYGLSASVSVLSLEPQFSTSALEFGNEGTVLKQFLMASAITATRPK